MTGPRPVQPWALTNLSNVAAVLSRARREVCGAPGGEHEQCDCLPGLLNRPGQVALAANMIGEKHTGCPELRAMIDEIDERGSRL